MWGYQEFLGKSKLYFGRAQNASEAAQEERTLWLLLGLEFLLRAPLARIHPALLANPDGDSILHAAGVIVAKASPKSVLMKTVVDRLTKLNPALEPSFGTDRAADALYLSDLRNGELHSADATLANLDPKAWMPRFLDVVEATCRLLDHKVTDFLNEEIIDQAVAYREMADRATQTAVKQLIANALIRYRGLSAPEIESRKAQKLSIFSGLYVIQGCPACNEDAATLSLSPGRRTQAMFDEESDEIKYTEVYVVESLSCGVCGLSLDTTAKVMAAGMPRLHMREYAEDRYEGWEDRISYEDAMAHFADDDYGND